MIYASQLRPGMAIRFSGQLYKVLSANYQPGQGKMGGVTHASLRNLSTATLWEHSFRSELKLEDLPVEKHAMDFLYSDSDQCYFMDPETYDQTAIPSAVIGGPVAFLRPAMRLSVEFVEGRPVNVDFPNILEIEVTNTAPPTHQQQDSSWKDARLENGVEVKVPLFIKNGDKIRLDIQSLKYVERAKTAGRQF
jgi:elongation factor P